MIAQPACYLDYNASAPLKAPVREAMAGALDLSGNPSSIHGFGRACRAAVEDARRAVAALVAARPAQVVFTSGGTEANRLALGGIAAAARLVSAIEHESVLATAPDAARLPVDRHGVVDLAALDALLAAAPAPALVSLMLVNNETGAIQPVAEAARLVRRHGGLLHCDAVQAAGRLPLDRQALGADLLSLSAHKLGGPAGVGALVIDERLVPTPLQAGGGGQERRRRAGTENLVGIVGFGQAARLVADDLADRPRLGAWRDRLEREIRVLSPTVEVLSEGAPRVATTSCLALPGVAAATLVMALDLAGVAVGAGAACSSGKIEPSHVLTAMGAPPALAAAAIRISLGWASREHDIDRFLAAWNDVRRRLARLEGAAA